MVVQKTMMRFSGRAGLQHEDSEQSTISVIQMNQRESAIQKIDDVLGMSQPLFSDESSYTIKKWVRGEVEHMKRYLDHHIHGARKRSLQESMNVSL